MKRTAALIAAAAAVLALSGCADAAAPDRTGALASQLEERAGGGTSVSPPLAEIEGAPARSALVIVCPYATQEAVDEAVRDRLRR